MNLAFPSKPTVRSKNGRGSAGKREEKFSMITVTPKAQEKIEAYFKENPRTPVRILMTDSSCCGQNLSIALDQIGEADNRYDVQGITYAVARDLEAQLGGITIDFIEQEGRAGFQVTSENPLPGAQACGGSCCS
jgi:Fe-S cluster assembly iron-binding protein IscA